MRRCSRCKKIKSLNEFRFSKARKLNREYVCILCKRIQEEKYRERNREKIRRTQRLHYSKNRKTIRAKRRKSYNPLKAKARWMARRLREQKCALCERKGERHHPDYNQPLFVIFLCKSHHKKVHDGTISL